jgi:outer membrane protein assembly factor BamB
MEGVLMKLKLCNGISIVAFLLVFYPLSTFANTWAMTYGGKQWDNAESVHETSDGGFIVAGSTVVNPHPERPSTDYWILKLDDQGSPVWQKAYNGPSEDDGYPYGLDRLTSFQKTSDNGYIAAGYTKGPEDFDMWILKLDDTGDILWQKTYSGVASDGASSIRETSDGGFIVAGQTQVAIEDYPEEFQDVAWVLKLDKDGEIVWQKAYQKAFSEFKPNSINETPDGGFIVVGDSQYYDGFSHFWVLKLDGDGNIIWQNEYDGDRKDSASSAKVTSDGGVLVSGVSEWYGTYTRAWLFKLDSKGEILWNKFYYGGNSEYGTHVFHDFQETSDGNIIIAGYITHEWVEYGWILRLNSEGAILWQKKIADHLGINSIKSIKETQDGGFIAAGTTQTDPQDQGADYIVVKLDGNGNIPDCNIMQDTNVTAADDSLTKVPLEGEQSDTEATVSETSTKPLNTQRVAQSPCSNVNHLISSDFDNDEDGFTYHDDTFNNTNRPFYADGGWGPDELDSHGSGLYVSVGGVDGVDIVDGMSGGWQKDFTLNADANIEVSLTYDLKTGRYDSDECAQVLVAIENEVGSVVEKLEKLCGRSKSTGRVTTSFNQELMKGTHTLTVGVYNNKKTGAREQADAYFDDISVVIVDPSIGRETECEDSLDNDGDDLTE